jgi:hypothetical protein
MRCNIYVSGDGFNSCNVDLTEQEFIAVSKVFSALAIEAGNDKYMPRCSITPYKSSIESPAKQVIKPELKPKKPKYQHKTAMQLAMEKAGIIAS